MSEFTNDYKVESIVNAAMMKIERCRPDFEGMIEKENRSTELLSNLYGAIKAIVFENNINTRLSNSKLKDLLGTVHVDIEQKKETIKNLINEQENYKE